MNIKDDILGAIVRNGQMTMAEFKDVLPSLTDERVKGNIYQLTNLKLIERVRDDVTGMPAYRLTATGKAAAKEATPAEPEAQRAQEPELTKQTEADGLRQRCDELEEANRELMRLLNEANGAATSMGEPAVAKVPAPVIGYACLVEEDELQVHPTEGDARMRAVQALKDDPSVGKIHVVTIIDTAEFAVSWKGVA